MHRGIHYSLSLNHFLHYNVETEESSVHVLKLGGGASRVVTKGEDAKRQEEEQSIKEGRVEKRDIQEPKEAEE